MDIVEIRQLFSGGIELDIQTAYKKINLHKNEKLAISVIEEEFKKYISNGVLSVRYSLKDPNELSELRSFESESKVDTFKKSKNPIKNTTTGAIYNFNDCLLVEYYKLVNAENIYMGLSPIDESVKLSCIIFGCDAISFSKKDSDDQVRLYTNLTSILSDCLNELDISPSNVIAIPTGDGYFIIFHSYHDPLIVVQFSYEVQKKIKEKSLALPLRIGIEIGTVFKIVHKTNQPNAIGHSLNSCSRIMSFGKENHILVSGTFYDACVSHSDIKNSFHDFGEMKDKHGYKYHVYNYSKDSIGNNDPIEQIADNSDCGNRP
jgi:hypothetical protein